MSVIVQVSNGHDGSRTDKEQQRRGVNYRYKLLSTCVPVGTPHAPSLHVQWHYVMAL